MTEKGGNGAAGETTREEGKRLPDPYGLYRQWFDALGGAWGEEDAGPIDPAELQEMWRRWFETIAGAHVGTATPERGFEGSMTPLWTEMAKDISEKMLSTEPSPEELFAFFSRWYKATSEKWSEMAQGLAKDEEALETGRRSLETRARSYEELRRTSEEMLRGLQVPSRSDVARVARLVRQLEEKFDAFEESFEEAVGGLDDRMGRLEGKIERLLVALEGAPRGGDAEDARDAPG